MKELAEYMAGQHANYTATLAIMNGGYQFRSWSADKRGPRGVPIGVSPREFGCRNLYRMAACPDRWVYDPDGNCMERFVHEPSYDNRNLFRWVLRFGSEDLNHEIIELFR